MKGPLYLFVFGLIFISSNLFAQRAITGRVTSADGEGVGGVSVLVKGASNQSVTNSSGNFSISATEGATLIFRFVGLLTVERIVGKENVVNVVMQDDASSIDEVVVTAFGIDRARKSLGYSTPKVSGDDVSETQRAAFFNGLQGRVPGLSINSTSGLPGASAQIILRGFSSISGDNSALIIIDGVPVDNSTLNENDLALNGANRDLDYSNRGMDLDPNDIESYVVMKGPEATALYGSQGAGGAILITTKRAKSGTFVANYGYAGRVEKVGKMPERQFIYALGTNGNYDGTSAYSLGPKYKEGVKLYTDNIDNFFRTGYNQNHTLNLSGGSEKISYRWSNAYGDNTGIVPNSRYKRFSTRLAGTSKFGEKVDVNTSLNYVTSQNDKARRGLTGYLNTLLRFNPLYDIRNWIDQKDNRVLNTGSIFSELDNPFWDVYRNIANDEVNRVLGTTSVSYKANKWLSVNGTAGFEYSLTHGENVYHPQSYSGSGSASAPTNGEMSVYDRSANIFSGSLVASTNTKLGKNFSLGVRIGGEFKQYHYVTNSQYGEDFFDPNFYSINNTYADTRLAKSITADNRTLGMFAQTTWGYQEILYLTLTGRFDGASTLMPNNPWFAYPSASFAFNFTDLNYFKDNVSWLTSGKLRASMGTTGKAPYRPYFTKSRMEGQYSTGGGYAYGANGGNDKLRAEKSTDREFGIEFSLFKDRVTFDYTNFHRLITEQIILPRLSYGSGFVLKMMNGGDVETYGSEIQLQVTPIKQPDLKWDLTFNYTQYAGKVKSLASELPELYDSDTWILSGTRSAVHPGYSIGSLSGTTFQRNAKGDVLINPGTGLPIAGDGRYEAIGDRIPKFTLGTINKLQYKDFYLTFLWDLRVGGDVLNGLDYRMYTYGLSSKTLNREEPRVIAGVLKDGLEESETPTKNSIAITPYYTSTYYFTNIEPKSFVERDIYTMRLRDVTLKYTLPKSLTRRIGENTGMDVFVTGTDLIMFTNYTGIDPESNSNTPGIGGIGGYGIDFGNMGKPIGVNVGVNLKF